jgi:hypothetical protein
MNQVHSKIYIIKKNTYSETEIKKATLDLDVALDFLLNRVKNNFWRVEVWQGDRLVNYHRIKLDDVGNKKRLKKILISTIIDQS